MQTHHHVDGYEDSIWLQIYLITYTRSMERKVELFNLLQYKFRLQL